MSLLFLVVLALRLNRVDLDSLGHLVLLFLPVLRALQTSLLDLDFQEHPVHLSVLEGLELFDQFRCRYLCLEDLADPKQIYYSTGVKGVL